MVSKFLIGLFVVSLVATNARAADDEDHLVPDQSIFGGNQFQDYDRIVVGVLKDAYSSDVAVRELSLPSFSPESAVGLRKRGTDYEIFALRSSIYLWSYQVLEDEENAKDANGNSMRDEKAIAELKSGMPADWHDVKVTRCSAPIDPALAKRLIDVWGQMLLQARFPKPTSPGIETVGVDGVSFYFYSYGKSAQTWSPEGGKVGALADIGGAMAEYCQQHTNEHLKALSDKTDALLALLKKDP